MTAFFSPVEDPASWDFSVVEVTIPAGMRYGGYSFRGVQAARDPAAKVFVPASGILGREVGEAGGVFVEVQVNPFPIRQIVTALPWGVPTFYLVFDAGAVLTFDAGNTELSTVNVVTIAMAGQDRIVRDPALWASQILEAIPGDSDKLEWQPFVTALENGINALPSAPVLLLDHKGDPRRNGIVDIVFGPPGSETVHRAALEPADGGDLQKTVKRMNEDDAMPIENLWESETSFRLRPVSSDPNPESDFQLVRLEDGTTAGDEITVTPAQRHISFTNLHDWFAEQLAIHVDPTQPVIERYTRDNRLTPLVNGPAFFDDLFRQLHAVDGSGQGLHLTGGFSLFPDEELFTRSDADHPTLPLTIREAAEQIGAAGGACRFLSGQFIQIEPDEIVSDFEIWAFYFLAFTVVLLNRVNLLLSLVRTDFAGGVALLILLLYINHALVSYLVIEDGRPVEPMKDAVNRLNDPTIDSINLFSPYPATVEDNPELHSLEDFPFDVIFDVIRHFGFYHQKFAIVRNIEGYLGYCGGIDLNPNRLDDANHLGASPYHDVHAKVEGPAVSDLALTFEQRWDQEQERLHPDPNDRELLAFVTPAVTDLEIPPIELETPSIVQVARTYFAPADPFRGLKAAPDGDSAIFRTTLAAIRSAREYIYLEDQYFTPPDSYTDALCEKVKKKEIRKLIISIPTVTDQPFGEINRSDAISRLHDAEIEAGVEPGEIVQIGFPRRHYTVPDNDLRASSGKCILGEAIDPVPADTGFDTTIVLGPLDRLPSPPFWVAIEGELMWVYEDASTPDPPEGTKRFLVDRGDRTKLIKGGSDPQGAKVRPYKIEKGAAASVVELSGIYVHAKLIIIDDVFLGIGSANINRRGFFHDGEAHVFSIPQALKATARNPVEALRHEIWAEMLNLPYEMAAPLLEDPVAAAKLFGRSPLTGNRYVDITAQPDRLLFGATGGGDILISTFLKFAIDATLIVNHEALFDGIIDPTSALEDTV